MTNMSKVGPAGKLWRQVGDSFHLTLKLMLLNHSEAHREACTQTQAYKCPHPLTCGTTQGVNTPG